MKKKLYFTFFKFLIGLALIVLPFVWIFHKIDLQQLSNTLLKIQWWTFPVLIACNLIIMSLQGVRWWLLIKAFSKDLPFSQAMSFHFSSIFYSIVLPNSTAQEILRTLFVQKKVGSIVSWSSAWICKITGLITSVFFSLTGLLLLKNGNLPGYVFLSMGILVAFILIATLFSMSKKFSRPLRKVVMKFTPVKFFKWIENLREGIYQYRNKKESVGLAVGITVLIQIIFVVSVFFIIKGITGSNFFIECLAFIPLIEIISMAQPFTPNGIGIRDALIVLMFNHLGPLKRTNRYVYHYFTLFSFTKISGNDSSHY